MDASMLEAILIWKCVAQWPILKRHGTRSVRLVRTSSDLSLEYSSSSSSSLSNIQQFKQVSVVRIRIFRRPVVPSIRRVAISGAFRGDSLRRGREILIGVGVQLQHAKLMAKHKTHLPHYNHTLATILVEYASAVYMSDLTELFTWTCSRCDGLTKGFEIIELVVDIQHCLQGFVGVAKDPNAIVIAFRGTQERSIQNWIEDLFWKQLDIDYPGMPDAMVHRGFYYAYHNTTIRSAIINAVKRAKKFYGDIQIIVTGHSMGGAMASFCALDLTVNEEAENIQVMTFGQPRIGNAAFASYYSKLVPNTIRVTHDHDIVPHLPPYYSYFPHKTYHHFPREVWLYDIGFGSLVYEVEKICDGSGEDPTCSRSVAGNSLLDHLVYFGVEMGSDAQSCRIVMDPQFLGYSSRDPKGNLILSKDPASPTLELSKKFDNQEMRVSVD